MTTNTYRKGSSDYAKVLNDMVAMCGLGEETKTNAADLAASIDANESVVSRLRTFAERVGGLQVRYEGNMVDGRLRGRSSYWRFVMSAPRMIKRAEELWGFDGIDNHQLDHKMPPLERGSNPNGGRPMHKKTTMGTNHEQGTPPQQEETQIAQEAKKIRTKIAEPEALIEAINQYRHRESFIEQELARFHEMGIEIDRSAIKFEANDAYDQMVPLVEFIEKLQGAIERMSVMKNSTASLADIERLKRELTESREETRRVRTAHTDYMAQERVRMQAKERRIKELETELTNMATQKLQSIATR
jgi:hypothetical protein